ncbi:MAG: flagellar motor switch protein FliN [Desulfobulbaceae bacterium]|nr:flagellar motor switch protein FliN [Desulfobulbaceae bacterium]
MADEPLDDAWADALEDSNSASAAPAEAASDDAWGDSDDSTQSADFAELGGGASAEEVGTQNLDFLLDVPLEVTVELGHTNMIINNMLQLTQGSVVELDKAAGEAVEIFVNNKLLGKGEVIVVNERFGVRITEIISQADRIKNMG